MKNKSFAINTQLRFLSLIFLFSISLCFNLQAQDGEADIDVIFELGDKKNTFILKDTKANMQLSDNQLKGSLNLNKAQGYLSLKMQVTDDIKNISEFFCLFNFNTTIGGETVIIKSGKYKPKEVTANYVVFAVDH